ncbi:hypothetical protein BpHYR1_031662 [Brachionus plicatilis]|uniref:Uncharacterized protein n=1 Tax=Brachionus plicatilis TaxID=10195 RepID=A0A3M7QFM4_BRAPC|nr:hypothetical protein BpHYR1_031662 [Brachionus plicatilis]
MDLAKIIAIEFKLNNLVYHLPYDTLSTHCLFEDQKFLMTYVKQFFFFFCKIYRIIQNSITYKQDYTDVFVQSSTSSELKTSFLKSQMSYSNEQLNINKYKREAERNFSSVMFNTFYFPLHFLTVLHRRTSTEPIYNKIRRRPLDWLGHVLRMPTDRIPRVWHLKEREMLQGQRWPERDETHMKTSANCR